MVEEHPADPRPADVRAARVTRLTALCWIAVLLVTALFHELRGAPVDAVLYAAAAALLVLDVVGWLRVPLRLRVDRDTVSRRIIAGMLIGVAAVSLALAPLYGGIDQVIVIGLGVLLLPVAWADRTAGADAHARTRPAADRRALRRAAILWSAVIVAGCAWEVVAFFLGRSLPAREQDFPALSDLLDPLIAWPPARGVLVALWLLAGYALIRRGRSA